MVRAEDGPETLQCWGGSKARLSHQCPYFPWGPRAHPLSFTHRGGPSQVCPSINPDQNSNGKGGQKGKPWEWKGASLASTSTASGCGAHSQPRSMTRHSGDLLGHSVSVNRHEHRADPDLLHKPTHKGPQRVRVSGNTVGHTRSRIQDLEKPPKPWGQNPGAPT